MAMDYARVVLVAFERDSVVSCRGKVSQKQAWTSRSNSTLNQEKYYLNHAVLLLHDDCEACPPNGVVGHDPVSLPSNLERNVLLPVLFVSAPHQ